MSTDTLCPPRQARPAFVLLASLATAGCFLFHHTSPHLSALCTGANVSQRVTLVIDSVNPAAEATLMQLQGKRFDAMLNLFNPISTAQCEDRTGDASISRDELPDELARATTRKGSGRWQLDGVRVMVDLDPGSLTNDLMLELPLDGSAGSWHLMSLGGAVAGGRLIPQHQ